MSAKAKPQVMVAEGASDVFTWLRTEDKRWRILTLALKGVIL